MRTRRVSVAPLAASVGALACLCAALAGITLALGGSPRERSVQHIELPLVSSAAITIRCSISEGGTWDCKYSVERQPDDKTPPSAP